MKKEQLKGVLGIIALYLIIILGVVLVNYRIGIMQKNVDAEAPTHTNVNQTINK